VLRVEAAAQCPFPSGLLEGNQERRRIGGDALDNSDTSNEGDDQADSNMTDRSKLFTRGGAGGRGVRAIDLVRILGLGASKCGPKVIKGATEHPSDLA
jgi:hypothetical protein